MFGPFYECRLLMPVDILQQSVDQSDLAADLGILGRIEVTVGLMADEVWFDLKSSGMRLTSVIFNGATYEQKVLPDGSHGSVFLPREVLAQVYQGDSDIEFVLMRDSLRRNKFFVTGYAARSLSPEGYYISRGCAWTMAVVSAVQ